MISRATFTLVFLLLEAANTAPGSKHDGPRHVSVDYCMRDETDNGECTDEREGELRLAYCVDGIAGEVEICFGKEWKRVCDDRWDQGNNAQVVCRLLDLPYEDAVVTVDSQFGELDHPHFALDDVRCNGTENALTECYHAGPDLHNCVSGESAGVICKGLEVCKEEGAVRLGGHDDKNNGSVEICHDKRWGLVCDDHWDDKDAQVVCNQLGFDSSQATGHKCGDIVDNDIFWLDDVMCNGNESALHECGHSGYGEHNCIPEEVAVVDCGGCPIRGQVFMECGTACPAVCGEEQPLFCTLQCVPECQCPRGTLLDTINKRCVTECPPGPSGPPDTTSTSDTTDTTVTTSTPIEPPDTTGTTSTTPGTTPGTTSTPTPGTTETTTTSETSPSPPPTTPTPSDPCDDGTVRLVGGNATSGIVEICNENSWRSICDDFWTYRGARVACRLLELPWEGASAITGLVFGPDEPIEYWLDDVNCEGNEESLFACPHAGIGLHNCHTRERAGVVCQGRERRQASCEDGDIDLVRGRSPHEGSVQICMYGEWRSVCDDDWSDAAAGVACRRHGYPAEGATATHQSHFGAIYPVHFWLDDVICSGTEASLLDCQHSDIGLHDCAFSERAGVICQGNTPTVSGSGSGFQPTMPPLRYATEGVVTINEAGINGTIRFIPTGIRGLLIEVELRGLEASAEYDWYIHVYPIDEMAAMRCASAGPHYDPTNVLDTSCNYEKDCDIETPDECEFGDLTGRYGPVTGMMSIEASHLNFFRILGRSVVIHDHEGGRIACGNIEPDFECDPGQIDIHHVAIDAFAGPIQVCLHYKWHRVIDSRWSESDAIVACRHLGLPYRDAIPIYFNMNIFGDDRRMRNVTTAGHCRGGEADMMACPDHGNMTSMRPGQRDKKFAGVICQEMYELPE